MRGRGMAGYINCINCQCLAHYLPGFMALVVADVTVTVEGGSV